MPQGTATVLGYRVEDSHPVRVGVDDLEGPLFVRLDDPPGQHRADALDHAASERLTGAILDRLTHRVHILEANGESYRLRESRGRLKARKA